MIALRKYNNNDQEFASNIESQPLKKRKVRNKIKLE